MLVAVSSRTALGGEAEDKRAECMMWAHLENKTLPLQVGYLYNNSSWSGTVAASSFNYVRGGPLSLASFFFGGYTVIRFM